MYKRLSLVFCTLAVVVAATVLVSCGAKTASGAGQYQDVKDAVGKLVGIVDTFSSDLDKVADAAGAAKALDDFVTSFSAAKTTFDDLQKKYPELTDSSKSPPPELKAVVDQFSDVGSKMVEAMTKLAPYQADPAVQAAAAKLQALQ